MTKRGPLNKLEKFFISGNAGKLEAEQIAKEIDRPVEQVTKELEKHKSKIEPKQPVVTETRKRRETMAMQSFGRHKRNGKTVVTVSTPAVSEQADDFRKMSKGKLPDALKSAIHRPLGEE